MNILTAILRGSFVVAMVATILCALFPQLPVEYAVGGLVVTGIIILLDWIHGFTLLLVPKTTGVLKGGRRGR